MRVYEEWSDAELTEEFERLTKDASRWHKNAVDAANSGGMGMAYFREYEDKAKELWLAAGAITNEMRIFRGHTNFPNSLNK